MWMQVVGAHGYTNNEPSQHHHLHHHQVDGSRKLRPLIPRPSSSASASSLECNFGLYTSDGSVGTGEKGFSQKNVNSSSNRDKYKEESKGGRRGQEAVISATSSSRWNPTAEQLRTLEDLYTNGTRTPSTDQIQRITAQLRRFGNIEGKNVFYWFQNHKARERQKRRRQSHLHPILNPTKQLLNITPTRPATRPHYAAAEEFGEMSMQHQRRGEEKAIADNRSESATTLNNHIIGSRADCAVACLRFQLDDQRNATRNNFAPTSYSTAAPEVDGVTFKTRRLVATDQTTTHRETTSQLLYEDQDSATLLQLFPLRSQVNGGQEPNDEDELSKERDDVHFFEFLPTKIN